VFNTKVVTLPVGFAPSDIAFADVNGDGLLDIVASDEASGDVAVLLNDPAHAFTRVERFRAGTGLFGTATTAGGVQVTSEEQPVGVVAGDFTGNRLNDVVAVDRGAHALTLLAGDGSGGFLDPQAAGSVSTSDPGAVNALPGPIVAADFHAGDGLDAVRAGKGDLAVLMEDRAQVWIYTGDGQGHFSHTFSIDAGSQPTGLSLVRDAATGFDDLLVGNASGDVLRLIDNGDGTFRTVSGDHVALDVRTVAGQPQVLLANQQANHVLIETPQAGGNSFLPTQTVAAAPATTPFAPVDARQFPLDPGSSTPADIVVANASNQVQIDRFNPATGTFSTTAIPVGTNPVSVTVATLAGQTVPDLFVANQGSNDVSVILGSIVNGLWVGTPGPRLKSAGFGPIAADLVSDANSPGGFDLAITNQDGTLDILPGRGNGFFDDRNPVILHLPGTLPPEAVAPVPNEPLPLIQTPGQILDPNQGGRPVFTAPAGQVIGAVGAATDGRLVVALGGLVEVLQQDAAGNFDVTETLTELTPLLGPPSDPSALEVLETADGLRAFVTSAGLDDVFVFGEPGGGGGGGGGGPPGNPPSGPLNPEPVLPSHPAGVTTVVEASVPAGAPLSLVLTLVAGAATVPADAPAAAAGDVAETALLGGQGAVAGLSSGDDEATEEVVAFESGLTGIDVDDALRRLELYGPTRDPDADGATLRSEPPPGGARRVLAAATAAPAGAVPDPFPDLRIEDRGSRVEDRGSKIEDQVCLAILDPRSSILDCDAAPPPAAVEPGQTPVNVPESDALRPPTAATDVVFQTPDAGDEAGAALLMAFLTGGLGWWPRRRFVPASRTVTTAWPEECCR
jgi:hypothetical protein